MEQARELDLIIVGGGIGGIISLKYARDAGLEALLFERSGRIGGLWRDLPPWQDLQIRREDWTLGDLPMEGEDQASVLRNIEAWVERFGLASHIRVKSAVSGARPSPNGWTVDAGGQSYQARYLIAATGGHNRPVVPGTERRDPALREFHSSQLPDPELLRGQRVAVVGGGASAFDLLDLCFTRGAARVDWIYRSIKWMRPTRGPKYFGADVRLLTRHQMLGLTPAKLSRYADAQLRARYAKAGIPELAPAEPFDIERHQIIPGRPAMIANARRIAHHRAEVRTVEGTTIELSNEERIEADLLLWGTGYAADLGYLGVDALSGMTDLKEIGRRCRAIFRSGDAPNLFLLAPGVLETTTVTPWAYAHAAKSIMSHIAGRAELDAPPYPGMINHCDMVKLLARLDRATYPRGFWYLTYLRRALWYPKSRPLPIP
jgi:cation diffusion facilitator CzcD-associated flavoprotein CzcO